MVYESARKSTLIFILNKTNDLKNEIPRPKIFIQQPASYNFFLTKKRKENITCYEICLILHTVYTPLLRLRHNWHEGRCRRGAYNSNYNNILSIIIQQTKKLHQSHTHTYLNYVMSAASLT